jgi:pilus assembly protein Flp/PilA
MKTYLQQAIAFLRDEEGASAIEYALLVALVALGIAAALTTFSGKITSLYNRVGTQLDTYGTSS